MIMINQNLASAQPLQTTQTSQENPAQSNTPQTIPASSDSLQTSHAKPPKKKIKLPLVIAVILLLVVVGGAAAHYMGFIPLDHLKQFFITDESATTTQDSSTNDLNAETAITSSFAEESLFSGKLQKLAEDLQIFKDPEFPQNYEDGLQAVYYSAGVFNSSPLEGYTRIIAIREPEGPAGIIAYTLATQDFENYILHDPENLAETLPENDWQNPYQYLDKNKIVDTQTFATHHTQVIELDDTFALNLKDYLTEYEITKESAEGYDVYSPSLTTTLTGYEPLSSNYSALKLFFKPYETIENNEPGIPEVYLTAQRIKNEYFLGETSVVVTDSTGLSMLYSLTTKPAIERYNQEKVVFDRDFQDYQQLIEKYEAGELEEYPAFPNYVEKPSLGFSSNSIQTAANLQFYENYHAAIPGACGIDLDTPFIKIDESQLEEFGSAYGLPLYRLADSNHDLNKLAYSNKFDQYLETDELGYETFANMHDGASIPTYEEYLTKNPILILKDYWDRWTMIGEYDILLLGGCGKPVVYLYPTEPTQVEVKLLKPVQFTANLPHYHQGWRVLAQPDGTLTDLQPEITDCNAINSTKPGLEYGRQACEANSYPYLYWAGNVMDSRYPQADGGWVVSRAELDYFLKGKLDEMGLNPSEKLEFISYWLPQMLAKDANFFRVSFLQTQQLNQFIPMAVTPTPDTVFRIFLDWETLSSKPSQLPEPQQLQHLERNGFTLVEWGGLKW